MLLALISQPLTIALFCNSLEKKKNKIRHDVFTIVLLLLKTIIIVLLPSKPHCQHGDSSQRESTYFKLYIHTNVI